VGDERVANGPQDPRLELSGTADHPGLLQDPLGARADLLEPRDRVFDPAAW
jgi:hypothetical protein